MAFIRRSSQFPSLETLQQIEGVYIVDTPPPGRVNGVSTGVVAIVGEFADMTYAVAVSATGGISTSTQPQRIYSAQDLLDKFGGWDETLGQFGGDLGNAFAALRNKRFSGLVCVPVNFASSAGIRLWRELPTCTSATNPLPIVPVTGATVAAGRQFYTGSNLSRLAKRVTFSALAPLVLGTDGAITSGGVAFTNTFSSAGSDFVTAGVAEGDALVLGVIGGAGALGANADTYRITAVNSATSLTVQKQDGSSWDWTTGTAQPFRIEPAANADTGGEHQLSETAAYVLPARALGPSSQAVDTNITPSVVPTAATATSWDPLSGLGGHTHPSLGLVYTSAVQAANAANDSAIDALYSTALQALLAEEAPARDVNVLVTARHSTTIASAARTVALQRSGQGLGMTYVHSPPLSDVDTTTEAVATAYPGVGAYRSERVMYGWPGVQHFVPEAVGTEITGADGNVYDDGYLDDSFDTWIASILSNLPPERNPAQASEPIPTLLSGVAGFQRAATAIQLTMNDYSALKAAGIMAPRFPRGGTAKIQSGVTTSLTSGEETIARRRMADFIEDSLAQRLAQFSQDLLTEDLKDTIEGETVSFLEELLSENNPAAQRIAGYTVDTESGNTESLLAAGVFVVIVRVRTLASADYLVLQVEAGNGVVLVTAN